MASQLTGYYEQPPTGVSTSPYSYGFDPFSFDPNSTTPPPGVAQSFWDSQSVAQRQALLSNYQSAEQQNQAALSGINSGGNNLSMSDYINWQRTGQVPQGMTAQQMQQAWNDYAQTLAPSDSGLIPSLMSGVRSAVEPVANALPSPSDVGNFMDRSGLGNLIAYGSILAPLAGAVGGLVSGAGGPSLSFGAGSTGATTFPVDTASAGGSFTPISSGGSAISSSATGLAGSGVTTAPSRLLNGPVQTVGDTLNSGGGMLNNLFSGGGISQWFPLIGAGAGLLDSLTQPDSQTTTQGGTSTSTQTQTPNPAISAAGQDALAQLQGLNQTGQLGQVPNLASEISLASQRAGELSNYQPGTSMFASGMDINPYLQSAFDRAANLTQPRLQSEFARAGRSGAPAQGTLRADELGAISSGLLLPLMEAERNRQFQATESGLNRGLSAAGLNLSALNPLMTAGQLSMNQQQQQLNSPFTGFSQYLSGIQGVNPLLPSTQTQNTSQTGNVTQPLYSSPISSALGGALLGSNVANNWNQPSLFGNPYMNLFG